MSFSWCADMILPWLNAIGHGRKDLALITGDKGEKRDFSHQVKCRKASNGKVTEGFSCIFGPMPHVCFFRTYKVSG